MELTTVDQLEEKILESNSVNIVDVRADEETAMGTILGTKTILMDRVVDNLNRFNKNETYYIICTAGVRSEKVVDYLGNEGIHAVNVEGGMQAWGDEGTRVDSI